MGVGLLTGRASALLRSLAVVVLAASCQSSSPGSPSADAGPPPPASVTFPKGFLWGTASAAYQVEKGNDDTDWGQWVNMPNTIKNGDKPDVGGPDALDHIDDDVALMQAQGMNAYRFSIEWARLYPTLDAFQADTPDAAAVTAYTTLLTKLQAAHITPLVTLVHFSLPIYAADATQSASPQGFERADVPAMVGSWCGKAAKLFGAQVDLWATLNEPSGPPLAGYIAGYFPPGVVLSSDRALADFHGEALAHVACYDAVHASDTVDADGDGKAAVVSLVNQSRVVEPRDPTNPDDVAAAAHIAYINNLWFWNVAVRGDWDDDLDGTLTGPNYCTGDPALKGRADYVGLNYYSVVQESAGAGVIVPLLHAAAPVVDYLATTRPKTDTMTDIYPEGFAVVLSEVAAYGLPIYVTENGLADGTDANRPRFLAEHLYQLGWAMQRGLDIRGYFHWSLLDNFEWNSGFCPKFGLTSVDHTTGARTPRPSFTTYQHIIQANGISTAEIDALAPYTTPANPCP